MNNNNSTIITSDKKKFKNIITSIFTGALILILPSILIIIFLHFFSTTQNHNISIAYSGKFLFLYSLLSLTVTLIITKLSRINKNSTHTPKNTPALTFKAYFFFSILTLLTGIFIELINYLFLSSAPVTPWQQNLVNTNSSPEDIILLLIATVIFAPIWEEILFRNYLFFCWGKYLSSTATIFLTAICWSLLHFQQYSPFILVNILFIGLIFGYTRNRYNSLKLPIFLHIINNLFAFIYMYTYSI